MHSIPSAAWFRTLALAVAVVTLTAALAPDAGAGFVPSASGETSTAGVWSAKGRDLEILRQALESRVVSQRLADLGYAPKEIEARLHRLDQAQVHALATRAQGLQTGGDPMGVTLAFMAAVFVFILFTEAFVR